MQRLTICVLFAGDAMISKRYLGRIIAGQQPQPDMTITVQLLKYSSNATKKVPPTKHSPGVVMMKI